MHPLNPEPPAPIITEQIYTTAAAGLKIPTDTVPITLQLPHIMS